MATYENLVAEFGKSCREMSDYAQKKGVEQSTLAYQAIMAKADRAEDRKASFRVAVAELAASGGVSMNYVTTRAKIGYLLSIITTANTLPMKGLQDHLSPLVSFDRDNIVYSLDGNWLASLTEFSSSPKTVDDCKKLRADILPPTVRAPSKTAKEVKADHTAIKPLAHPVDIAQNVEKMVSASTDPVSMLIGAVKNLSADDLAAFLFGFGRLTTDPEGVSSFISGVKTGIDAGENPVEKWEKIIDAVESAIVAESEPVAQAA